MTDLCGVDAGTHARLAGKGIDVRPARVVLCRYKDGQPNRLDGVYPIEEVTRAWLLRKFGAGSYDVLVYNAQGLRLAVNRAYVVDDNASFPGLPHGGLPPPSSAPGDEPLERQLMRVMMVRALQPPPDDPLKQTVAVMLQMQAQAAAQQAAWTQAQLQMLEARAQGSPNEAWARDLVTSIVGQKAQAPAPGGLGGVDPMGMLNLGLALGKQLSGAAPSKDPDADIPPALRILPELADSIGVPLLVTIAQAVLPPEAAARVVEAVKAQQETRQAEAAAPDEPEAAP
jgi:hypothetical protein